MQGNRDLRVHFRMLLAAVSFAPIASDAGAQEWEWGAALYLWGASLGAETASGTRAEVSFDTLLKDLNYGAMAEITADRGRWTLLGDFLYLDAGDTEDGSIDLGFGSVDAELDVQTSALIATLGAAYKVVQTPTANFGVLGGLRYLGLDSEINAEVDGLKGGVSGDDSLVDGIIGFRGTADFSDRWYFTYYADVGTGQSELTWQALASVNYRFERVDVSLGYRYLAWQFDDFAGFDEMDVSGPLLGIRFTF